MTIAVQTSFTELGTPLFEVTFVVVDLETTGLSPGNDRITEIGAVRVRAGEVLGEFQTLIHPGRPIPAGITAVTGINDAMVRGCPPITSALPTFLEFARDSVLVAHNARFDHGFLTAELERHGYPPLEHVVLDTAAIARRVLRDEVRDVRLETLARHLRARVAPEHRALIDARATVDVLHGLLERAGSLGATTLEDLRDYTRSTTDRAFRKVSLVADAPEAPGVYRFLDAGGDTLYVGTTRNLRQRLRRYFGGDRRRRIADLVRDTDRVTWTLTPTAIEAEVTEVRAIHQHRPRYNRRSKHPEKGVWVKLTKERFPRLSIVTGVRDDGADYLGPLPSRRRAQQFCEAVYDALPVRQCTMRIRAGQDHPACALKDLGRCGAPCDGTQTTEGYAEVIGRLSEAVAGDCGPLLEPLRQRMQELAEQGRFERAGTARHRLHATAEVIATARRTAGLVEVAELVVMRQADRDDVGGTEAGAVDAVLVRHGRLAASARFAAGTDEDVMVRALRARALPTLPAGPPAREDVEEIRLVRTWLDGPGARILHVEGELAQAWLGGALLAATLGEARTVQRAVRRDRQILRGDKVTRRTTSAA